MRKIKSAINFHISSQKAEHDVARTPNPRSPNRRRTIPVMGADEGSVLFLGNYESGTEQTR